MLLLTQLLYNLPLINNQRHVLIAVILNIKFLSRKLKKINPFTVANDRPVNQ